MKSFSAKVGNQPLEAEIELASEVDEKLADEFEKSDPTPGFSQVKDNPTNCTDLFMCSIDSPPGNSVIEVSITLFKDLFLTGDVLTLILPTSFVPRIYVHEETKKSQKNAK